MNAIPYTYELRDGSAVVSTGWLTLEAAPAEGDTLPLHGGVARIEQLLPGRPPRLVLVRSGAQGATATS